MQAQAEYRNERHGGYTDQRSREAAGARRPGQYFLVKT